MRIVAKTQFQRNLPHGKFCVRKQPFGFQYNTVFNDVSGRFAKIFFYHCIKVIRRYGQLSSLFLRHFLLPKLQIDQLTELGNQ